MAGDVRGLVEELKEKGVLNSPPLIRALLKVDRADFVPQDLRHLAYEDAPLPIGAGQTISQPYTVVFMLERLDVRPGQKVLEIGYGSGWQTALLAHALGEGGSVFAMELVSELCERGKSNLRQYPDLRPRAHLRCRSAREGYGEGAPYDRVIASAEVIEAPDSWRKQLRVGGKMIYPQDGGLMLEKKRERGFERERIPGFAFVPFI